MPVLGSNRDAWKLEMGSPAGLPISVSARLPRSNQILSGSDLFAIRVAGPTHFPRLP